MTETPLAPDIAPEMASELERIDRMVVPGRRCGSCSLCCKVVSIPELSKPAGKWCQHCKPGNGCGIHLTRPVVCRGAYCEWMISQGLGLEWKPDKTKFVLFKTNGGRRLTAHVDPGNPDAWRRSPFYENLKAWAKEAAQKSPMHLVDVMIGDHAIVILPDRDVEIGVIPADETITLEPTMTAQGVRIEVRREKRATEVA